MHFTLDQTGVLFGSPGILTISKICPDKLVTVISNTFGCGNSQNLANLAEPMICQKAQKSMTALLSGILKMPASKFKIFK